MLVTEGDLNFDPEFYVSRYPDVPQSGLEPAAHFAWLGSRLGRLPTPTDTIGRHDKLLDVLFVDGSDGSISASYRVQRVAEALADRGAKVRILAGRDAEAAEWADCAARYVTFFRAPMREPYRSLAMRARSRGSRIVFDVDDLVFDEELIPFIDGYRCLPPHLQAEYRSTVRSYRDFVLIADFCTVPTGYLASRVKALGRPAFRIRNGLDGQAIRKFAETPGVSVGERFVVGYYSGSNTHQADFREAASALVTFMEENPAVTFRLVGHFDLGEFPKLLRYAEGGGNKPRLMTVPPMSHTDMLADQLNCDLIIAPLEVGNPFCESKSELKFFEGALALRPVIAAATATFREATRNGELALLAGLAEQWLAALRRSFAEREQSVAIARRAHDYVVDAYSPAAVATDALVAYRDISSS